MKRIIEMNFKERSLLFAKLSDIAYLNPKDAARIANRLNFTTVEFYNNDGAQAFRFMNKHDVVIACRGTQATQWNDIKADLRAVPIMAETIGRVHKGFKIEVDDLWPMIKEDLNRIKQSRKAWFCGHSLGAAMTTIMASRCNYDLDMPDIQEVYTFGSPRVGWRKYCNSLNVKHHRFVNNNDIVPRVPLWIMGYRHHGKLYYFNRFGKLAKQTLRDRIRGMWNDMKKGSIDIISDHSMTAYIPCIEKM